MWNYFATSHGKGSVDGIGGAVKRQVRSEVLKRKCIVSNAAKFSEVASKCTSVKVIALSQIDIDERNGRLNLKKITENAEQVPGITKFHAICVKSQKVHGFTLSKELHDQPNTTERGSGSFHIGDWVEVQYEGHRYPGIVNAINFEQNDYLVNVMVKSGVNWKWPLKPDEIYYKRENIVKKISPPNVMNARGHYKFDDL